MAMEKFDMLTAIAAPLPIANINTDIILPARYLKTINREGLGKAAFYTLRYDDAGRDRPDFVLNRDRYAGAQILLAGANFGCGSSREHAPWALADFGLRCIIAPSFADIFYHNCFKNGILCIALTQDQIDRLTALVGSSDPAEAVLTVDLEATSITARDGSVIRFEIDPTKRENLLLGLDDIDKTSRYAADIARFESTVAAARPWTDRAIAP